MSKKTFAKIFCFEIEGKARLPATQWSILPRNDAKFEHLAHGRKRQKK